jgi:hypothetical protein
VIGWVAAWAAEPRADELLSRARRAEQDGRWAEAVAACEEVLATAPRPPEAETCGVYLAGWAARRDADGSFTSLAAIERVRRGAQGPDTLAAWAEDASVPAVLRAEAALLRARAALDGGDATTARAVLGPWRGSALGDPRVEALVLALDDEAAAVLGGDAPPGTRGAQQVRARWVASLDAAALAAVAVTTAACLPAAGRGLRRRPRPWGLAVLAAAAVGAWLLAEGFDPGSGHPIPPLAVGLAAVHAWTLPALAGASPGGRLLVRGAAAVASLAVVWLALSRWGGLAALGAQ